MAGGAVALAPSGEALGLPAAAASQAAGLDCSEERPCAGAAAGELEGFPFDVEALVERCSDNEIIETPAGGLVIRGLLSDSEQQSLYNHLTDLASGTSVQSDLRRLSRDPADEGAGAADEELEAARRIPLPVAYWRHPYSRACSVEREPRRLLRWAEELLHTLLPETSHLQVDSMLAQAYFAHGRLGPHLDRDLSWGLGLSLGAAACFRCWRHGCPVPEEITLHSGDLIIGEFGKMLHSVEVLGEETVPAWWPSASAGAAETRRCRCNVLFRQALSEERQRELSEPRARALYGKSYEEVAGNLGQTLGECALTLRHEMDKYEGKDAH